MSIMEVQPTATAQSPTLPSMDSLAGVCGFIAMSVGVGCGVVFAGLAFLQMLGAGA